MCSRETTGTLCAPRDRDHETFRFGTSVERYRWRQRDGERRSNAKSKENRSFGSIAHRRARHAKADVISRGRSRGRCEGSGLHQAMTVIKRLRRNLAEEPEFVAMLVAEPHARA